jgi:hypothetical protein
MTKPSPFPVVASAVAGFLAVFGFLGVQLRTGHDPALGAVAKAPPQPKRVLVKRLIKRKVVVTIKPAPEADGGGAVVGSAPSVSTTAPAATPAPAPAPAPVATRSS